MYIKHVANRGGQEHPLSKRISSDGRVIGFCVGIIAASGLFYISSINRASSDFTFYTIGGTCIVILSARLGSVLIRVYRS